MEVSNLIRALNIALRSVTLTSRFFLIFFLARFLEPAQLGLYGLIAATVGYSLYLVGFDFYTFTTRELLKRDRKEWGGLLKDQGAFSLVLYGVFTPLLSLIFFNQLLPWSLAGWFFLLLVFEHLNQELSRLLIAISEQLLASVVLFIRQGTWAIAVVTLMTLEPATRSLSYVLGAWAVASVLSALVGVYRLSRLDIGGWNKKINWKWIWLGLRICIPLLMATLAIRGIFTLDRYLIQSLAGLEVVGAYILFMGIGGALMTFLDAGVFSFSYPGLIAAYQRAEPLAFRKNLRSLLVQTLALAATFFTVSLISFPFLMDWLGNSLYVTYQHLFPWILVVMILYSVGMVPHYALYAQGIDRPIIQSHLASLLVFAAVSWAFSSYSPLLAVPLALIAAFLLILIWKAWAFFRFTPLPYRSIKKLPE